MTCLKDMHKHGLVRTISAEPVSSENSVIITATGGYYLHILIKTFVYAESCLFDTAISDEDKWQEISDLTHTIEFRGDPEKKMQKRVDRIKLFLDYLHKLEQDILSLLPNSQELMYVESIKKGVVEDAEDALQKTKRRKLIS